MAKTVPARKASARKASTVEASGRIYDVDYIAGANYVQVVLLLEGENKNLVLAVRHNLPIYNALLAALLSSRPVTLEYRDDDTRQPSEIERVTIDRDGPRLQNNVVQLTAEPDGTWSVEVRSGRSTVKGFTTDLRCQMLIGSAIATSTDVQEFAVNHGLITRAKINRP